MFYVVWLETSRGLTDEGPRWGWQMEVLGAGGQGATGRGALGCARPQPLIVAPVCRSRGESEREEGQGKDRRAQRQEQDEGRGWAASASGRTRR